MFRPGGLPKKSEENKNIDEEQFSKDIKIIVGDDDIDDILLNDIPDVGKGLLINKENKSSLLEIDDEDKLYALDNIQPIIQKTISDNKPNKIQSEEINKNIETINEVTENVNDESININLTVKNENIISNDKQQNISKNGNIRAVEEHLDVSSFGIINIYYRCTCSKSCSYIPIYIR